MKTQDRRREPGALDVSPTLYLELFAVLMIAATVTRLALTCHATAWGLAAYDFRSGTFTTTGTATPLSHGDAGLDDAFDKTSTWENADTVVLPALPTLPRI